MEVYLVQHGEAQPKSVDPARPLTERGRQDAQRVAAFATSPFKRAIPMARRLGLEVEQIRHSGKTRAEQTAVAFGEALSPPGGVVKVAGLAPKDAVQPVADALDSAPSEWPS